MRFSQIDRILALEVGKSITTVKGLSLSEDYLRDHFPRFPVMPGVLMVESMFQACMWLMRVTNDFEFSTIVLREAKSIKFQGFMQPGDQLVVVADIKRQEDSQTMLRVRGEVGGMIAVSGRMTVDSFNLAEREGLDEAYDNYMCMKHRLTFQRLCNQLGPENIAAGV